MASIVLALDIGTSCGWAVQRPSGRVESGRVVLTAGGRQGVRLHAFRLWLSDLHSRLGMIDTIVWEHAHQQQGRANEVHHNLVGVLLDFCERNRITDYHRVEVGTLKAFAIGDHRKAGADRADKDDMMSAARALGFQVSSHDEADAVHLLRYEITGQREADVPRLAAARQKRREQARKRNAKKRAANQNTRSVIA